MLPTIFRRAANVALAAAIVCLALACDRSSQGTVNVLVIGKSLRVADPAVGPLTTPQTVLLANTAQGLVRFDARGQIEPGLAEAWNVSDDGLSYIFRLANTEWADGRKVTAERVAHLLRRQIASSSDNPLKESLAAVDEIVPMTERVIEIRLKSPRPQLLQLLAQPQMALVSGDSGTGPFEARRANGEVALTREVPTPDGEESGQEELRLAAAAADEAVRAFADGKADLVIGGTFVNLPVVRDAKIAARSIQFDPVSGLFGLMQLRTSGPFSDPAARQLLTQAIDRDALIAALGVPGLAPRATILEPGLANIPDPIAPQWAATPLAERQAELRLRAREIFGAGNERPQVRVALPEGPGAAILLDRLRRDWGALGLDVREAEGGTADFRLVDEAAPSTSPGWFLSRFSCDAARVCDEDVDTLLDSAAAAPVEPQRTALLFQASQRADELALFIPLAAPIRWSLVSSRITGFAGNRFGRHTLIGLEERLSRTD